MSTGSEPARRGLGWRVLHSLWLMLPVAGFGCLGASAFVYLGIRMRRRSVWIAGLVYLAITAPTFFIFASVPVGESTTLGDWSFGVFMVTWLVSILHALAINPAWLRFRATRATPLAPPPGYQAPAHHLNRPQPTPAGPPLDLNAASAEQLAALPHFDPARARLAVAERTRRGGFTDVYAFSDALRLQPHEYIRIFPHVVVNPPAPAPPPPTQGDSGLPGRIVDV
ncbi:MAG TPA: helix-hairpin-helix domain-containing protein [Asanoa sp.]|jgi:uncharacterized membrane protein (GlpM family)|nr:helix-hairpin-helix domain-containing protein [Asanoa sp.]